MIRADEPHLPGRTPRPADDLFDALKATVRPGVSPRDLGACACFRAGFDAFDRGFYWEAHELWEPVWLALPEGPDRALVRGLIQIANAALKRRMGWARAAARIDALAEAALARAWQAGDPALGVSRTQVARMQRVAQQEEQYSANIGART